MVWFKVDDGFWSHPKTLDLSADAVSLWVRSGSYCARHLTDGKVTRGTLRLTGGSVEVAAELVTAGLWEIDGDGWLFHDWAEYQPDAASSLARDQAKSAGGVLGNHQRWHVRRGVIVDGCEFCAAGSDRSTDQISDRSTDKNGIASGSLAGFPRESPGPGPGPIAETPSGVSSSRVRASRIPDDFTITPEMTAWAAENAPTVDAADQTARFVDYWRAESGPKARKVDWVSTWRNWIRRAEDDQKDRRLTPMEHAAQTAAAGRRFAALSPGHSRAQARQAANLSVVEQMAELDAADKRTLTMSPAAPESCPAGQHRRLPDGTCLNCTDR